MRICATFQKDTSRYHAVNIGKESPEEQPCQHCQHNKRMQNRASGYSQGTNRRDQDDKDLTGLNRICDLREDSLAVPEYLISFSFRRINCLLTNLGRYRFPLCGIPFQCLTDRFLRFHMHTTGRYAGSCCALFLGNIVNLQKSQ